MKRLSIYPQIKAAPSEYRDQVLSSGSITLSKKIEKTITNTGDEKSIVVESPSGNLDTEVNMNRIRNPPVNATRKSKKGTHRSRLPINEFFL